MDALAPIPGEDPVFLDALDQVTRLAAIDRPCLIVGERGSGKELFATRLHYLSPRWDGPLVKVNCAAFTESLLDSELFGHEMGAFTGAARRHIGCFERSEGGTLVLDEIASASAAVQEKLLRVVEYGELQRVGGSRTLSVDVRVVGVANIDLPELGSRGEFRADLLDRLAFDVVTVPPLRARRDDILLLARGFALEMVRSLGREVFTGFAEHVEAALLGHPWPGNVRELRNVIERAVYRSPAEADSVGELVFDPFDSPWRTPAKDRGPSSHPSGHHADTGPGVPPSEVTVHPEGFRAAVDQFEQSLLRDALERTRHNQRAAAADLELGYHQLRRLLDKHGLRPGQEG